MNDASCSLPARTHLASKETLKTSILIPSSQLNERARYADEVEELGIWLLDIFPRLFNQKIPSYFFYYMLWRKYYITEHFVNFLNLPLLFDCMAKEITERRLNLSLTAYENNHFGALLDVLSTYKYFRILDNYSISLLSCLAQMKKVYNKNK